MVAAGVGLALALRDVVGAYQHGCIVHKKYGFRATERVFVRCASEWFREL